jgi:hypothetical protein
MDSGSGIVWIPGVFSGAWSGQVRDAWTVPIGGACAAFPTRRSTLSATKTFDVFFSYNRKDAEVVPVRQNPT